MSEELQPCPFCGGLAGILGDFGLEHLICMDAKGECPAAQIGLPAHKPQLRREAIAAWNRRATRPSTSAAREVDERAAHDAFELAWKQALSDAAFYVAGHCANGDHHAEIIMEMLPPKLTLAGSARAALAAKTAVKSGE